MSDVSATPVLLEHPLPGVALLRHAHHQHHLLVEALVAIDRALTGLPAVVKAAFLYSQLDGLSYVEIGRKLALSERTVSRYMKQALRQCYLAEMAP